jgi:hypothetical protein
MVGNIFREMEEVTGRIFLESALTCGYFCRRSPGNSSTAGEWLAGLHAG